VEPAADAHAPGVSYARIDATQLVLVFAKPDLAARWPMDDLAAVTPILVEAILPRAVVAVDGAPCVVSDPTVAHADPGGGAVDGIRIAARLECPAGKSWTFEAGHLALLAPGHRELVERDGSPAGVVSAEHPAIELPAGAEASTLAVASQFVRLGIEHIWTGWDHLAFVFGLLLAARSVREIALVVTGFTVAHSITLSLAALGLVSLSPAFVEPAIALTIAFVGIENQLDPPARRRIFVTAGLGLIHGLGFAGALREIGLPRAHLALALGCFNVGVEIGQLAVVLAILPILLRLRREAWWRTTGVKAASAAVALAGLGWFVARVAGSVAP
jgi:hydrogenase/urease accessory protein HupE